MEQQSDQSKQVRNLFFAQDLIKQMNKMVLHQTNMSSTSREEKEEIAKVLIKNMKSVYKMIDTSRINNNNFDSIFDQYKKHSVMETINEIKKTAIPNPADMKFKRDFASNPNQGNKVFERPQPTKTNQNMSINERAMQVEQNRKNNNFQGVGANMGQYDSTLDSAFRPIVDNDEHTTFNNYTSNKKDVSSKMDEIQKMRQIEVNSRNQRPPTPDFLKSQKSNPDKDDGRNYQRSSQSSSQNNQPPMQNNRGGRPDFTSAKSEDMNQGFQGLANDSGGDFFSIDNFSNQPLADITMEEDTSNFEDRLKRLQSERANIKPSGNGQQSIDFTSDNYMQSGTMGDNSVPKQQQSFQQREREQQQSFQREVPPQQHQSFQREQPPQQQQSFQREQPPQQQQSFQREQPPQQQSFQREQPPQQREREDNNKFAHLKNSLKSVNINVESDTLKQKIMNLEKENLELKEMIDRINETGMTQDIEKLDIIKQQIAKEYEILTNKSDELDAKQTSLNAKEIEINKKELDVKQLIANYDYLFKSQQLQLEVSNNDNKSNYVWNMNPITNVMGIKLMSYSIPIPRFNIEENKNNILKLKIDNVEHDIIIRNGRYNIDDLIIALNNMLSEHNIKVSVNCEQNIEIESQDNKQFTIIPTQLSRYNMGFINTAEGSHHYISNKSWDLRIEDKVYLFLNNLSEDIPFGVLHFNGMSSCQFKFEKPYTMNRLEVIFKDSRGNTYNFHNLPHSLSFMIDRINN
jgi:hypothetical protein